MTQRFQIVRSAVKKIKQVDMIVWFGGNGVMEGVGECVAFDLNVKETALKTSEDSSSLRKEQTPGLRGWTETGRM